MELLVVVSVLAVLAALLFPSLKSVRDKALAAKCASNIGQVGRAALLYSVDNEGAFLPYFNPVMWYATLYGTYLKATNVFLCPAEPGAALNSSHVSYGYNIVMGGGGINVPSPYRLASVRKPAELFLFADSQAIVGMAGYLAKNPNPNKPPTVDPRHAGMVNIFWADGHVDRDNPLVLTNAAAWTP